jgi:5'-nucleotidase
MGRTCREEVLILSLCAIACRTPAQSAAAGDRITVRVIAFNDFHGNLRPPAPGVETEGGVVSAGGAAHLAAHVARLRSESKHSIVVSAGDLIGATPLISSLLHDEPTIDVMNAIGLDIAGIGNHELDEGLLELVRMTKGGCHEADGCRDGPFTGAKFPYLAANVWKDDAPIFDPYTISSFDGVPVAFIGLTLEDTPAVVPPVISELSFRDEADTVAALVPELEERGVRAIVVLVHEGGFSKGGFDACDGFSGPIEAVVRRMPKQVDVVVSAHTHQAYNCRIDGRVVTSAGCFGRFLTTIDLEIERSTGDVVSASAKNRIVDHSIDPDPSIAALIERFDRIAGPLERRVIGRARRPLLEEPNGAGESALGTVIADAQLASTRAAGAQVAFINGGGIRADLGVEQLDITYGMAFTAQPFNNVLVTMTLTGEHILRILRDQWKGDRPHFMFASQTLRYEWSDGGERVSPAAVTIEGEPLDLAKSYRVTVNAFLADRGVFREGVDRRIGPPDIDALVAYFASASPIDLPPAGRIRRGD